MYDACELITEHKHRFARPPLIDLGDADEFLEVNLRPKDLETACINTNQEITIRYQKVARVLIP